MRRAANGFVVTALGAFAVLAAGWTSGRAQTIRPEEARYQTGCVPVDAMTVEGFISNPGTSIIQIDGSVRFNFTLSNALSRPAVAVQAAAVIQPGRTVSLARARLAWSLLPNEVCQLDVSEAVR